MTAHQDLAQANREKTILYDALEFIANHDEGDHGVESFRKFAKQELVRYWKAVSGED